MLKVGDNGISLPQNINPGATDTFGLQMLNVFAKQLRASVEIERNEGTVFTLQFFGL